MSAVALVVHRQQETSLNEAQAHNRVIPKLHLDRQSDVRLPCIHAGDYQSLGETYCFHPSWSEVTLLKI